MQHGSGNRRDRTSRGKDLEYKNEGESDDQVLLDHAAGTPWEPDQEGDPVQIVVH